MNIRPHRSIVTRLAVTVASATGLLLVLLIAGTYLLAGRQLAVQLDDRLEEQAVALAADVDPANAANPVALADDLWGEELRPLLDAQLVGADGRVVASTGAVPGGGSLIDRATLASVLNGAIGRGTIEVDDELLRIHVRPVPDTDLALVVASDLDPVTRPRGVLIGVLVPVGAIGVLGLAVLAWTSTRRALRPLERMADRAGSIGGEQLSVRLPVTDAGTELDRLATTINRMVDRLETLIARERQFTADASHEMRTPLAIMRAELELAETATDEATRERLISAREEIDRLAALVDDLLVLARADSDHLDTVEPVDLTTLLDTVRNRFAPLAAHHRIELTAEATGMTQADLRGLDRALANLTDNALRHTPQGGRVHLHAATNDGVTYLTVSDTGPGVPPAKLATLFDRFSRTDTARTSGGAGLGLAIVAAVTHAHHGTVTAHNRSTGGLRIDITIPHHPPDGHRNSSADHAHHPLR